MKDVEKIVQDICELAPELASDREGVRKIVASLLEAKPDVVIDERFVRELQQKLQGSIRVQKAMHDTTVAPVGFVDRFTGLFAKKAVMGVIVLVLLVLVALPFVDLSTGTYSTNLSLAPQIKDSGEKLAFGSLMEYSGEEGVPEVAVEEFVLDSFRDDMVREDVSPTSVNMMQVEGMGGGAMDSMYDDATVSSVSPEMKGGMVYPDYQYPLYSYDGPMPTIEEEGYVYRRETGGGSDGVRGLLSGFNLGLIDLGSFKNIGLQRLELTTSGEPAYTISIDMQQGEVSIYRMWTGGYDNVQQTSVPYTKINNADMIQIANSFLKKHSIDVSGYGAPQVEEQQYYAMPMMDAAAGVARGDMSPEYMPIYNVNVRYPLVVDGMRVVEQGGYPAGINVSVNVSGGYVESVWGLTTQNYERSLYPQVTDTGKILDMLAYGGYSRGPVIDPAYTKTINIPTEEPEFVLMKYWKYDGSKGHSTELLVPATMFDVDQQSWNSRGIYVQDAIVIPLAKDIIEDSWDRPMPMPLMFEEGSAGSSPGGEATGGGVVESMPVVVTDVPEPKIAQ
jgi:hypothetical protein